MSNTIIIKHRTGSTGEPTLSTGEIAANIFDKRLYVGTGASNVVFADKTYIDTEIANLVDSAPGALDTLNELAAALGDDANFSTTITNSLALKAPIASPTFTGTPTAPNPPVSDNTTKIATTSWVLSEIAGAGGYTGWTVSDGANTENVGSASQVIFSGAGATSTSYNSGTDTLTITTPLTLSSYTNDTNFITATGVTYGNLNANGDVGTGASQVAAGNHTHAGVYEPVDANIARYNDSTANFTGTLQNSGISVLNANSTIDGGTY